MEAQSAKKQKMRKNLVSGICKNKHCCSCSSIKKQFKNKNLTIEELDEKILSKQQEIDELLNTLSTHICPSVFSDCKISE